MPPTTQRLIRIAVAHYRNREISEAEFHRWATEDHCARAAKIHARHGIEAYGMFFSSQSAQSTAKELNKHLGGKWIVDNHDVQVEFYLRSLSQLTAVLEDPEFKALQEEEGPFVSGENIVATLGWVEAYVQDGHVVHVGADGKPTYAGFGVVGDFSGEKFD